MLITFLKSKKQKRKQKKRERANLPFCSFGRPGSIPKKRVKKGSKKKEVKK